MSIPKGALSWLLVAVLSIAVLYQYIGANKAEQKAQDAEDAAKVLDAKLKDFMSQSETREKEAQARFEQSQQESANLRQILAKGSQRMPSVAIPSPAKPLSEVLKAQGSQPGQEAAKSAPEANCTPFIYQGSQLIIEQFQVMVCEGHTVVEADAAVALKDAKALTDKLNVQLAEDEAKIALEEKDLLGYKAAELQWKKAAKKSRIKRVLGVAEKVGLFAAGVYLGHKF